MRKLFILALATIVIVERYYANGLGRTGGRPNACLKMADGRLHSTYNHARLRAAGKPVLYSSDTMQ